MRKNYLIAKEGWAYIIATGLMTIIFFYISKQGLAYISLLLTIFVVFFFRNPKRQLTFDPNEIVAPADGKILAINEVYEDQYLQTNAIQIRIFLSVFDVHINRIPFAGIVEYIEKTGNRFFPANQDRAGKFNVQNSLGINTIYGKVLVVQITGFIARRIVCYLEIGDKVETGEKFGLIKFGSCTELYLPTNTEINVTTGQAIRGGETIIGKFNG